MRRSWVVLLASLALLAPMRGTADDAMPIVTTEGTELRLDGRPWRFTGLNIYNANSDGWCWYRMDTDHILEDALDAAGPGVEVIRAWFDQPLSIVDGARDLTRFRHTLDEAAARGIRVIVTFSGHWGECGTKAWGGEKPRAWYASEYATVVHPGLLTTYRDYVAEIVTAFAAHPAILMWQLMNEAEILDYDRETEPPVCLPGAADVLTDFASDVSSMIKALDPEHLVSFGTIGSGQCGTAGEDYRDVHALPTIDVCEYHDYSPATLPGDQWNGLLVRLQQCEELDKPLFIGEAGLRPDQLDGTLGARADRFDDKIDAQFGAGAVGYLAWNWSSLGSRTDDFDIGPGDPALGVLDAWAPRDHVPFPFGGFEEPLADPPAVNLVVGGQTVPVSFDLGGDEGLGVFAEGFPRSEAITCPEGPAHPVVAVELGSGLRYDDADRRYTYGWPTEVGWAGTCRALLLGFVDGSVRAAWFAFLPAPLV